MNLLPELMQISDQRSRFRRQKPVAVLCEDGWNPDQVVDAKSHEPYPEGRGISPLNLGSMKVARRWTNL
jgi:hypothetical protein